MTARWCYARSWFRKGDTSDFPGTTWNLSLVFQLLHLGIACQCWRAVCKFVIKLQFSLVMFSVPCCRKSTGCFGLLSWTLPFFSGKGTESCWDSIKCFRLFQKWEKGCLLSSHWQEEILHLLKSFHIQVLALNIDTKLRLYKATLHLWLFNLWACLGIEKHWP